MTDLPIEVHGALDAVDHIGYLIRRFATIKDREAGEHLVRDLATIRSALAAREYSKQREEKLREAVKMAVGGFEALAEAETKCGRLSGSRVLAEAADDETKRLLPILRAALAENGDENDG